MNTILVKMDNMSHSNGKTCKDVHVSVNTARLPEEHVDAEWTNSTLWAGTDESNVNGVIHSLTFSVSSAHSDFKTACSRLRHSKYSLNMAKR